MLQGTIGLLLFNSEGDILQQLHLSAKGPTLGIEIAKISFMPWWPWKPTA